MAARESGAAAKESSRSLVVSAPMVQVRTTAGGVVTLYQGDTITSKVSAESVDHLKSLGFVAEQ